MRGWTVSSAKHTKEPWETYRTTDGIQIITKDRMRRVALTRGLEAEDEANARLIAAAGTAASEAQALGFDGQAAIESLPDLLAALKVCASIMDRLTPEAYADIVRGSDRIGSLCPLSQARAAIAKAEGGEA